VDMRPVCALVAATDMVFFLVGWVWGIPVELLPALGGLRKCGQPGDGEFRIEGGPVSQHAVVERCVR
jgi:hypothetical protein